ncbi:MAG: NUDIX domain-containing protein [Agromyces sp.]
MSDPRLTGAIADAVVEHPVRSSETVYAGRIFAVHRDEVAYPGATLTRDYMVHPGAVGVLPMNELGEILLINQYRHPSRRQDWEVVAGLLDEPGESPLAAAKRELAEEADLVADSWHTLVDIIAAPGASDEAIRIFLARGISAAPNVHARTDEESHLLGRWVPLEEAVTAVLERRIQNGPMCTAVLAAAAAQQRGWSTLGDANEPWSGHPLWR